MNELIALTMAYLKATTDPSASDEDIIAALEALEAHMVAVGNTPEQVEYWCGYALELAEEEELFAEMVADVAIAGAAGWIKV
jgi:hypothetical protein